MEWWGLDWKAGQGQTKVGLFLQVMRNDQSTVSKVVTNNVWFLNLFPLDQWYKSEIEKIEREVAYRG